MNLHDNQRSLTSASVALLKALVVDEIEPEDLYGPDGAIVYESFAADDRSEIEEITAAVRLTSGPILELACGGGRITLPLLSLGRPVVAVDLSPVMVDILRERVAKLPSSRIPDGSRSVVSDMTAFEMEERFGAIVLAATSVALLDAAGRRAFFDTARKHLADDGQLFVTASSPGHDYLPGAQISRVRAIPGPFGGAGVVVVTSAVTSDGRYRDVDVVQLGRETAGSTAARLFQSRVQVVDADEVGTDAERSGLRVVSRTVLAGAEGTILIKLEKM